MKVSELIREASEFYLPTRERFIKKNEHDQITHANSLTMALLAYHNYDEDLIIDYTDDTDIFDIDQLAAEMFHQIYVGEFTESMGEWVVYQIYRLEDRQEATTEDIIEWLEERGW